MGRLPGFDYKSPFYYMVTLKRLKGLAAFSEIGERGIVPNAITRAFEKTIRSFHRVWRCCDEISPFAIMPDHLHLLMKIRPTPDRVALGVLVSQLAKALRRDYWNIVAAGCCRSRVCATVAADAATCKTPGFANRAEPRRSPGLAGRAAGLAGCASAQPRIFDPVWHDWIVKKDGQLAAFRRYIRENGVRAWQRRARKSASAPRGACSFSRSTRRRAASRLAPNSILVVMKWSISPSRGFRSFSLSLLAAAVPRFLFSPRPFLSLGLAGRASAQPSRRVLPVARRVLPAARRVLPVARLRDLAAEAATTLILESSTRQTPSPPPSAHTSRKAPRPTTPSKSLGEEQESKRPPPRVASSSATSP